MYCGNCEHVNSKKKKCDKYNKKLGYMKYSSKSLSYISFERCRECEEGGSNGENRKC